MPSETVVVNGRRIHRVPGAPDLDLGPADQPTTASADVPKWVRVMSNPELAGAATSLAADFAFPEKEGLSLAARVGRNVVLPAAVAGGTSIMRDVTAGERNPLSLAGNALMHAGVNAVPGGFGESTRMITKAPDAAKIAAGAVTGGAKGGVAAFIRSALGIGEEAAPKAIDTLAAHTAPLWDMSLNGVPVLSRDGLKALVQKSIDLENTPGAASPATRKALDDLIAQVRTALHPDNLSGADLLTKVGMQPGSFAADAASAATLAAKRKALALATRVRQMLGITNAVGGTTAEMLD